MKVSGVVITYNEEHNIGDCLESMREVVDEIIVVDSFSTDNTEAICTKLGARFIKNPFEGHIQQKNFAVEQASFDYVLSLDADERLDETLRKEISAIRERGDADGYVVSRLNNYCGKFVRYGEWNPDRKIRLWDRRKGRWAGENPHDRVVMAEGTSVKRLRGHLLHFTYRDLSQHLQQMIKFSDISAREAFGKGKRASIIHLTLYPFFIFIRSFVLKLGFLDGYHGYLVAVNGAYYRFLKYAKLRQLWLDARTTTKESLH